MIKPSAENTAHVLLLRHRLVAYEFGRCYESIGTFLQHVRQLDRFWCADYSGECNRVNQQQCYPRSIAYAGLRYLLICEALGAIKCAFAFVVAKIGFQFRVTDPDGVSCEDGTAVTSKGSDLAATIVKTANALSDGILPSIKAECAIEDVMSAYRKPTLNRGWDGYEVDVASGDSDLGWHS